MQAAEDRLGPDFSAFRQLRSISRPQPLAAAPLLIITRFMGRDPWPEAHVLVMAYPFFQHHSQMTFTEWNQEVQTFSPERSHQTFAKGIGLRHPTGVRSTLRSNASSSRSRLGEKIESRS
jgi:hypothetical protein